MASIQRPDVVRFIESLDSHADYLDPRVPLVVTRAPGRLDLMGGIADYSGSLVLQLPLDCATRVAAQATSDRRISVRSATAGVSGDEMEVSVALDELAPRGQVLDHAAAHALLTADPRRHWGAYVIGALVVLARECDLPLDRGIRLLVDSSVPAGKGVSSSAALEVAAMQAIAGLLGHDLAGRELALLCQRVENYIVGAPCGVMDQMTSACGEEGRLLALLCQPAELQGHVDLPPELEVWGIDSGIRHAVGGSDYGAVRTGAFMGQRILANLAALPVSIESDGVAHIDDGRWGGHLANVTPSEWDAHFRERMPEMLAGEEFLTRYGATADRVTRVDRERRYAVRVPTAHPIGEHDRVQRFRALLESDLHGTWRDDHGWLLGELMWQSHASYSACGLGSDGTDRLVELVRSASPDDGLYGAKITGGGSGGVVAVVGRRGSRQSVERIASRYAGESGGDATVLGGSSPGASVTGLVHIQR